MLRLLCIIAIVFIIIVLDSGTIVRSESPPYCGYSSETSRCPGDLVEIRAPFWIENRTADEYGGCISYPGFEVKCAANGRPVINISNNLYYVLSTELDEYGGGGSLVVVDVDIDAQECPQPRRNISIGSPRFLSNYNRINITFLYNCSKYPENVVQHVPCLYNNSSHGPSFAFFEDEISTHQFDWYGNCEDAVVLSNWGFSDSLVMEDSTELTEALKSGFRLYWGYPVNCGNCEFLGGKCWANETNITTTTPFHCNCTDGTTLMDDICPALGALVAPTLAPTLAPALAPSTSPAADSPMYYTADSPAGDSPMYYRSFDNGTMRRKMWMRNMKIKLIVLGIIIALILIIVMSICKGFNC